MFERTSAHLVQPPNQNRAKCEVTPGCSGFYQFESWKTSLLEAVQHVWTASPTGGQLSWWKWFCLYGIWSFHFNLHLLALVISLWASVKGPSPQCLPGGPPKTTSSPGWQALAVQPLLRGWVPASLVASSWACLFVGLGAPNPCSVLDVVWWMLGREGWTLPLLM